MKRKFLSILLTLAMALTLLPVSAMAEGEEGTAAPTGESETPAVEYVAQIGETKYTTLQEAIDAATAGQTVKLVADVTEDITISANKNVTLDLGNSKLTNKSGNTITVEKGGKLSISDSVGTGVVDNTSHG